MIELLKNMIKKILFYFWPSYRQGKIIEWRVDSMRDMIKNELSLMDKKYEMLFWYLYQNSGESIEEAKFRFFQMIPPARGRLRELQLKNIYILENLQEICRENNLTMWLEGGTLLGAIRHKGFIPWDDDIDVNMWSEDLEKLAVILENNDKFCYRNKFNYYLNCIVPGIEPRNGEGWVDIFPMEKINCDKLGFNETKKFINTCGKKMKLELEKNAKRKNYNVEFLDMKEKEAEVIRKIMKKYMELLQFSGQSNSCYRSLSALNSPGGADLFLLSDVLPFDEAEFEGKMYLVPKNSVLWLNTYYGDYLRVPLNILPKHFKS